MFQEIFRRNLAFHDGTNNTETILKHLLLYFKKHCRKLPAAFLIDLKCTHCKRFTKYFGKFSENVLKYFTQAFC